jgi:4-amino-4-deoxy-L-arabinose transferase-like glycosyltransferase
MATTETNFKFEYKQDGVNLLILILVALLIGIYLISTSVIISKDGVFYIDLAKKITENPSDIAANRPSGYEFLIFYGHMLMCFITGVSRVESWIWTGQGVALLCRLFAIIPLYFIGTRLIDRDIGFRGCLILLLLPIPAHFGSDVLREWPNLLFMSWGVLCFLCGVRENRPWTFFFVGLLGSLSFFIRPESVQIVLFAGVALTALMMKRSNKRERLKAIAGEALLIIGFCGPVLLYAGFSGQLSTRYMEHHITKAHSAVSDSITTQSESDFNGRSRNAIDHSLPAFLYELFKNAGELLMWFFLPFWGIGLYRRLSGKADAVERFFVVALISTGLLLILFRYWYIQPVIARRWCLPCMALTVFYIPVGIDSAGKWLQETHVIRGWDAAKWAHALLVVGILTCLPKLIKPLGYEKKEYRVAARWISENTRQGDLICSFDSRIPFYADRNYVVYKDNHKFNPNATADYFIVLSNEGKTEGMLPEAITLQRSFPMNAGKKEVQIFRYDP